MLPIPPHHLNIQSWWLPDIWNRKMLMTGQTSLNITKGHQCFPVGKIRPHSTSLHTRSQETPWVFPQLAAADTRSQHTLPQRHNSYHVVTSSTPHMLKWAGLQPHHSTGEIQGKKNWCKQVLSKRFYSNWKLYYFVWSHATRHCKRSVKKLKMLCSHCHLMRAWLKCTQFPNAMHP